mgnify:CR=1 FL=1
MRIGATLSPALMSLLDRELIDIALLEWTLARTPQVDAVTLESRLPDETALRHEVDLLRNLVAR